MNFSIFIFSYSQVTCHDVITVVLIIIKTLISRNNNYYNLKEYHEKCFMTSESVSFLPPYENISEFKMKSY